MHIPDGFLDAKTAIATTVFSVTGLGTALRHARQHLQSREIPLVGLTAAFIFVAQMLNFPVAGGTSGHLLGATLAMVLLGPSVAIIVMCSVLIIQAAIFADGGLLALGANIFNMAIVAPVSSYIIYKALRGLLRDTRGQLISASVASWCAVVIASVFCAGELAWSGTAAWNIVFPAMAGIHSIIGVVEGLITMLVLAAIAKTRPELLTDTSIIQLNRKENKPVLIYGAVIVIGLLLLVAPFASQLPDGLDRVAQSLGFETKKIENMGFSTPLKDYRFYGIDSPVLSTIAAGLTGTGIVFAISFLLAGVLIPRKKNADNSPPSI
jgi:cobalt/nickel transport system permease protein